MSRKLSLKEALGLQVDARDERPAPSVFRGEARKTKFLLAPLEIPQPVQVARTLMDLGLSLRKAHEALIGSPKAGPSPSNSTRGT